MGFELRALLITWLIGSALYFTYGQFVLEWIAVLPLSLALATCALPTPKWIARRFSLLCLLTVLAFLLIAGLSLLPPNFPGLRSMIVDVARTDLLPWMRGLFGLAAVFTVLLYFSRSFVVYGILVAVMISAYALAIPSSPTPQIDVWTVHEEGAQAFVDGENPYKHKFTNPYSEEVQKVLTPVGMMYPYLPGTFMWMSPWKALGLDTRYSQLITRTLTALLLLLICLRARGSRDFLSFVPSLIFLTFPLTTFFIVRAWNDDIAVMCYSLAAWALITRRPWALFVATNFLLLHKQYSIFFVPILLWYAGVSWRSWSVWVKGTIVAIAINGAYVIADWRMFLGSLYGLSFLRFPQMSVFVDRRDPFSLMNYFYLYTGHKSGLVFALVVVSIALLMLLRRRTLESMFRGFGAMALALFIFALAAYANYYEFAWGLIIVGWAMSREGNGWEIKANWSLIGYVASRSIILFCFSNLIVETHAFWTQSNAGLTEFINYHTWFQLAALACDVLIACLSFSRATQFGRSIFILGPLLIAPFYLTGPTLAFAAAAWIALRLSKPRFAWILAAGSGLAFAYVAIDFAGYDVSLDPLLSPTHAFIWMLALAPALPALKRRIPLAVSGACLTGALAMSFIFYYEIETIHANPSDFALALGARNALAVLAMICLALAIPLQPRVELSA